MSDAALPAARLAGLGRLSRLGLAAAAGVLMTAGQPPVSVPWGIFLALPLLVWLLDATPRPWGAFALGWAAAFGYFVSGLYWIGHAFMVDAERFAWMMPFAVTLLPAFLGLFWGTAFWLAWRRWPEGWTRVLVLAGWLTLIEYARGKVLTGFPWGLPGYVWTETPVAQAAAWTGPFGLTLLTLVLGALPLVGLAGGRAARVAGSAAVLALAGLWALGAGRLAAPMPVAEDAPVLRVVQPNATQHLKWDPEWAPVFYRRLLEETMAPVDPDLGPPDAVVWPETAVPFLPARAPERRAEIAASARGVPVLMGALARPGAAGRPVNALMVLDGEGEIVRRYDKHHLVPFGEYLPYPGFFGRLGFEKLVPGSGFASGPGPQVVEVAGLPPFSPQVCYEMIFPDGIIPDGARPDWLLHVTNDAWFGAYGGPQQHLAQARARAIEQGLPVIRAANTGISAHIDAYGRMVEQIPLDRHGHFDTKLSAPLAPTLYARTGDWVALVAALLLATLGLLVRKTYHS